MNDIKVEYKLLGLIKLSFERSVPASWSEVNPRQLIAIGEYYLGKYNDTHFIASFCKLPRPIVNLFHPYYILKLLEQIDFIKDFRARSNFILKKVAGGVRPKEKLEGLSFGQFIFIDTFFNDYAESMTDEISLNKFIACLYWPAKQRFSESKIAARADRVASLDPVTKQALVINYRLVKDWLAQSYPLVFSESSSKTADNPNRKKESPWLKVYDSIVSDDIVNADKYAQMNLHDVLRYITRKMKEHAKQRS